MKVAGLTLFLTLLLCLPSAAQALQWEVVPGPAGGSVVAFAPTADGEMMAQVSSTLYLSDDGGQTWTQRAVPDTVFAASQLVAEGTQANLFLQAESCWDVPGCFHRTLFRTTDGGLTWNSRPLTVDSLRIFDVFEVGPQLIVVGEQGGSFLGSGRGVVLLSTDGAETWDEAQGPVFHPFATLWTTNRSGAVALLRTDGEVFFSPDGGVTWRSERGTGLDASVHTLALDEADVLYAAQQSAATLWRSLNEGLSWAELPMPPDVSSIDRLFFADDILYASTDAGLLQSMDQGATWTALDFPTTIEVFTLFPLEPGVLLVGTAQGAFRVTGGGWSHSSAGMTGFSLGTLTADAFGTLYTGRAEVLWRSRDRGTTWDLIPTPATGTPYALASGTLLMGNFFGTHRSTDGGATWQAVDISLEAFAEAPDGTLYGLSIDNPLVPITRGIYRSADDGATWSRIGREPAFTFLLAADADGILYLSTDKGLYQLTPSDTFTQLGLENSGITSMAFGPPGQLFAGIGATRLPDGSFGGRVFRSDDSGATWTDILNHPEQLAGMVYAEGTLYVRAFDGVLTTDDDGLTWDLSGSEIFAQSQGSALVLGGDGYLYMPDRTWLWRTQMPVATSAFAEGASLAVEPNYPNPFAAQTTFTFALREASEVTLTAYDMLGRQVEIIAAGFYQTGQHRIGWDASGLANGVYFCRLQTPTGVHIQQVVLAR